MSDYTPATLTLVRGKIKRGDTINGWSFSLDGIPSPGDAVATFSAHLNELGSEPLIELVSPDDITLSVEGGKLLGEVPMINAPGGPGKLFWELEIRVPTVEVAVDLPIWLEWSTYLQTYTRSGISLTIRRS